MKIVEHSQSQSQKLSCSKSATVKSFLVAKSTTVKKFRVTAAIPVTRFGNKCRYYNIIIINVGLQQLCLVDVERGLAVLQG